MLRAEVSGTYLAEAESVQKSELCNSTRSENRNVKNYYRLKRNNFLGCDVSYFIPSNQDGSRDHGLVYSRLPATFY